MLLCVTLFLTGFCRLFLSLLLLLLLLIIIIIITILIIMIIIILIIMILWLILTLLIMITRMLYFLNSRPHRRSIHLFKVCSYRFTYWSTYALLYLFVYLPTSWPGSAASSNTDTIRYYVHIRYSVLYTIFGLIMYGIIYDTPNTALGCFTYGFTIISTTYVSDVHIKLVTVSHVLAMFILWYLTMVQIVQYSYYDCIILFSTLVCLNQALSCPCLCVVFKWSY